jgi:CubicO group peptidase (beta-lactamase class C family)
MRRISAPSLGFTVAGLALSLLSPIALLAQDIDVARADKIVQSFVASSQFMGSVLVARDGQILVDKGYGYADLEWQVPNTPETKFRLGSMTKQFTAAAILLLEERGKLSTDDLVKKYMPDTPAAWDKMTIYHLLTHTSGIPNFTSFPDYRSSEGTPTTPAQLVARFRDKPLDFQPGEKWNYSNSGYVLLGYLIEKISGQSYRSFLEENFFKPLGMNDSGYDSNSAVILHHASGYSPGPKGPVNAGYIDMSVPFSAGALYSTTHDLLRWEEALYGGKVLSPAALKKMTTPFKQNYACGLMVQTVRGHTAYEHGGAIEGFNTDMAYYPDEKLTLIALSNLNGNAPNSILEQLGEVAHGEKAALPSERKATTVSPDILARYVGVYALSPNANMNITLANGQLVSQMTGQGKVPLLAESETMFFPTVVNAEIEFPKDEKGPASQLTLHQNGRDVTAKRLDEAAAKKLAEAAAAFDKRYKDQTAAPGSEAAVRRLISELQAGTPNYDLMSPNLADATRQQLTGLHSMLNGMGSLQSVAFKGVGPGGADIYQVNFEKGSLDYRVWLGADGKVESANVRPSENSPTGPTVAH